MPDLLLGTPGHGRTAHPPVGRRRTALAAPLLVVLCFAVAAPLAELLAALGTGRDPAAALVAFGAAALAVGWFARPAASLVIGLLFWLFFDGFVVHHSGTLGWDGARDALRLGVLVGAGLLGGLLGALAPGVRSVLAGLRTATTGRLARASLEPFEPVAPPPGHPWYWN
ncbi:hypothetical protein [Streptacidiphilus sp. P02-A3a]|uniref:hypothetical protein n=1 Tax=Streptacidiphilus sp. P02-A3a TaxID=2704468 RepID=UPI0015FA152F|nr:hypothetical protein [Streptacidiphilus sp. P02-A3a]QMU68786.1 hypothetical protein GXP74_11625 [Streptacidiphilus sp. P02-A3a]